MPQLLPALDDVFLTTLGFIVLVGVICWVGWTLKRFRTWLRADWRLRRNKPETSTSRAPGARAALDEDVDKLLRSQAERAADRFEHTPADSRLRLLDDRVFAAAVDQVRTLALPTETLVALTLGYDDWVTRIVLPVLAERNDLPDRWRSMAIRRLDAAPWDLAGLYLLSLEKAPGDVIGNAIAKADEVRGEDLAALITARVQSGREQVDLDTIRRHMPISGAEQIQALIEAYDLPESVHRAFSEWLESMLDFGEAGRYIKVRTRPFSDRAILLEGRREDVAEEILGALQEAPPRSVIVVGEHGVGKSAVIGAALERLPAGWIAFEAGAAQINADAMYVGQLEGRIEDLVERLRGRTAVWIFPAFEEALYAGTYSNHPTGMLDLLLPHIEAGTIRIVAETTPSNYETLVAKRPRMQSALRALRLRPLGQAETVRVLSHALANRTDSVTTQDEVLSETFELAQQFLPGVAQPGGAIRLLATTVDAAVESETASFEAGDVLSSLAALTGLPLALLDPNRPLDLESVRGFFSERVLGQEEAVRVIVDRIALVKAGLTDPTRPLGVFLFVGPTGTGKTELAKTLAQFMFGSVTRLVRLDMSEFQTPDALERLLSDPSVAETGATLIASVRKDPFSVVLLDEFEKAAAPVWDLFLQVFDDGRLTDRSGRTTDFRHCIIILTSNVGSALQWGPALGFSPLEPQFRPSEVERELRRAFRPEFLNRIDRIVTFRPFGREQMRALLDKELDEMLRRRGLRGKPWAIEVDETAITLLLDAGFSPTLGARPLRRAVEEHLLTPLARTIVDAAAPTGDQFLFVTAPHGRIEVHFVDLGEEQVESPKEPARELEPVSGEVDVRELLRSGRYDVEGQRLLLKRLRDVETRVRNEIGERKQLALDQVSSPDFWTSDERYGVLAEAEYLDRLEAASRTASKLGNRLRGRLDAKRLDSDSNGSGEADLCSLLAFRVYSLESALAGLDAGAPFELFLRLRLVGEQGIAPEDEQFLEQLVRMYLGWAERRGMHVQVLDRSGGEALLHAGGLGAGVILRPEDGLHVFEMPATKQDGRRHERSLDRITVAIQVAECVPSERTGDPALLEQARRAFRHAAVPGQVVRRYRLRPSALVRDAVRGYRTGKLDEVLAGSFDLFAHES